MSLSDSTQDALSAKERFTVASGIAYALLWLVGGFFSPEGPEDETATAEQIVTFFADNGSTLAVGVTLALVGSGFFLLFLGGLCNALQRAEGERGELLTRVAFAGGLLTAGLFLAGTAMSAVPLLVELEKAQPVLVQTWYALSGVGNEALGDVTTITRALLIGAASVVVLRSSSLPRWLGWFGALVALLSLMANLFPLDVGVFGLLWFVSFLLFPVWVLVASIRLTVRADTAKREAALSPGLR